jgi:hypothetical protein
MPRIVQALFLSAIVGAAVGVGLDQDLSGAVAAESEPCKVGSLSVSSSLNPVATAYGPGTWVQRLAVVTNTTGADLNDARFDFIIGPDNQKIGAKPSVRWNIDGGTWHAMSFYRTNIGMPVWRSDDNQLPAIRNASKHTVRFSVSFPTGATEGSYFTQFNIGSASCGLTWLGGTSNMNFGYLPSYAPKSTPTKSSPRPRASHVKVAASLPSPSNSVAPSPSASPQPSVSPSPESSFGALQALAPANSAPGSRLPVTAMVALASAAVLAIASPVVLWRRRVRSSSPR